jgi:hypothetical protein
VPVTGLGLAEAAVSTLGPALPTDTAARPLSAPALARTLAVPGVAPLV